MGKQIDADKLIEHFINKTPNGWLVPIYENESRWTLEGIISEIECFDPTVQAIPKDQYEARLKADLVAILEDLDLQIDESASYNLEVAKVQRLIRDKINVLRGEKDETDKSNK